MSTETYNAFSILLQTVIGIAVVATFIVYYYQLQGFSQHCYRLRCGKQVLNLQLRQIELWSRSQTRIRSVVLGGAAQARRSVVLRSRRENL